jgi:AcrR family transcriptional regulator
MVLEYHDRWVMIQAYEHTGRTRQKRRTREALVAAARSLVARGETPTVEAAANAAGISRTTAYRYFPAQHALLAAAHPETERESLLPRDPPADPERRLALVIAEMTRILLDTEAQQRTMLRLSLAEPERRGELPLRQGRAIRWIEDALSPLRDRLTRAELRRLVLAIRSAAGIEALVWLTDVAGLSSKEAVSVLRFSARGILRAALVDHE